MKNYLPWKMTGFSSKIKRKLREKSGATFIEMAIGLFIFVLTLAFIVQFVPVLILKNQLNTYANNVSRILSVEGENSVAVKEKIEEYKSVSEIGDVDLSLDGTIFISGTDKIQLNDMIIVTVTTEYDIGFFNLGSFKVPLKNKAQASNLVNSQEVF
ncbi:MAG: DUF4320 family protein [Anaerocolumna sp.]